MRKTPVLTILAVVLAAAAGTASADGWFGKPTISLEQAVAKAQAAGYAEIRGAEYEDGAWEVRSNRPDGSRLTVFVDATTGDILSPAQPGQKQLGPAEVAAVGSSRWYWASASLISAGGAARSSQGMPNSRKSCDHSDQTLSWM